MHRAGQATRRPPRAEAAMHRGTPAQYDQDVLPFSKVKREAAAQRRPAKSERKNCSSPVRQFSAFTPARQGHPFRLLPLMQRVAGAKAIPDARRADGAPQQARTSPGPQGREGSRRCPTRHAADGVQPNSRDYFRVTPKRGVRGCRGCRGARPLSPHAPRRAGDLLPVPGSSRDAQRNTDSIRPGRFTFFKGETL